jgi:hypothetical protein
MGLDWIGGGPRACIRVSGLLLVLALAGCRGGDRPERLLDGERAVEFKPAPGSVVASARVLSGTALGGRFEACRPQGVARDALVVERIGVFGESLTFTDRRRRVLYACDGGEDPAREHLRPWCSTSAGRLLEGHLLDPRLDLGCRDREGRPLAYAWIEPVRGARWVGVDQGPYEEVYEALGGLPVRIVARRRIDLGASRASFVVTQYDLDGSALLEGVVEAAVAG